MHQGTRFIDQVAADGLTPPISCRLADTPIQWAMANLGIVHCARSKAHL